MQITIFIKYRINKHALILTVDASNITGLSVSIQRTHSIILAVQYKHAHVTQCIPYRSTQRVFSTLA